MGKKKHRESDGVIIRKVENGFLVIDYECQVQLGQFCAKSLDEAFSIAKMLFTGEV
jgi:hypothetical protein